MLSASLPFYSPRAAFSGIAQLPTAAQPARSGRSCCSVAGWVGFFAPSRCHSDCGPGRDTATRRRRQHSHSPVDLRGAVRYRRCAGAGGSGAGLPPRSPAGRRAVRCLPPLGSFLTARKGRCLVPCVDFGVVAGSLSSNQRGCSALLTAGGWNGF